MDAATFCLAHTCVVSSTHSNTVLLMIGLSEQNLLFWYLYSVHHVPVPSLPFLVLVSVRVCGVQGCYRSMSFNSTVHRIVQYLVQHSRIAVQYVCTSLLSSISIHERGPPICSRNQRRSVVSMTATRNRMH